MTPRSGAILVGSAVLALSVLILAAYTALDRSVRSTGAYAMAMERVDTDAEIGKALGRPITRGLWVERESGALLTLRIPLSGTLEDGILEVVSSPDATTVESVVLIVGGARTDLLARDAQVLLQNSAREAWTLGAAKLKAGEHAEAEQLLSDALDLDDTMANAFFLRGKARIGLRKHEEAEADLRRAAELDPTDPQIHTTLGEMYTAARRYSDCIDAYTEVLTIDREDSEGWYRRAICYQRKRDYRKAIAGAREACTGGLEDACAMEARLKGQ